jgi:hypothetical protein
LTTEQVNQLVATAVANALANTPVPREVSLMENIDFTANTTEPNGTTHLIPHTFIVQSPLMSNTDEVMTYTDDRGFTLNGWNVLIAKGRFVAGADSKTFTVSQFTENLIDGADSEIAPLQAIGQMVVKINSGPNKGHIRVVNSVDGKTFTTATDWGDPITGFVDFEILANEYDYLPLNVNTLGDVSSFSAAPN